MFPLFLCGPVKLQQIALVKDLSQELTNAGGTNHECSNEGDTTKQLHSFWDPLFVLKKEEQVN